MARLEDREGVLEAGRLNVSGELARLREELGPLDQRDLMLLQFGRLVTVEKEVADIKVRLDQAPRAGETSWCIDQTKRVAAVEDDLRVLREVDLQSVKDDVLVFKTKERVMVAFAGIGGSVAGSVVTAIILSVLLGSG